MYRGFQIRKVNQIINRLKVNLCVTELTCLIFNEVFIHAKRRITFNILKLYYHEPFSNIDDEVNFNDKLSIKLSDIYYNFNNFTKQRKRIRRKIKHINNIWSHIIIYILERSIIFNIVIFLCCQNIDIKFKMWKYFWSIILIFNN